MNSHNKMDDRAGADDRAGTAGQIKAIADLLRSKENIVILTHNSADGDTLGCSIAVGRALHRLNKNACILYEEKYTEYLEFLLEGYGSLIFLDDDPGALDRAWDAVIVFDTADPKLLGKRERMLNQAGCVINIDHHISNRLFGDVNLVVPGASATAELAYQLLAELGVPLDHYMALAIYTGICTDTGGFSYSNTTCASHEIAAKTLAFGIDVAHLRYKFFDAITPGKLHCHAYVANTLRFHDGGKYAIAVVSAEALDKIGATEADCEGLVNIGRNVVGVEVSVFAREIRPGEFRVNLRSRGSYDVSEVARKFEGGGHKLAAGCTVIAPSGEIESILLNALNEAR